MRRCIAVLLLLPALGHASVLAAHRASYTLTLRSSRDQSVVAAHGLMVFDLQQACGGLVTTQHVAIDLTDRDGRDSRIVTDYATFEAADGTRLDFHSRQTTGGAPTEIVDGTASLDRAGMHGLAHYANPEARTLRLPPGTKLPNAHTASILNAAMAGRRFLSLPLFDGTSASGAEDTFVTIIGRDPPAPEKWPALARLPSSRVHVSFFTPGAMEETPDYEVAMRYFDNGVADDLTMDFGDFAMHGALTGLDQHAAPRC
jgi:hypothetical protein